MKVVGGGHYLRAVNDGARTVYKLVFTQGAQKLTAMIGM